MKLSEASPAKDRLRDPQRRFASIDCNAAHAPDLLFAIPAGIGSVGWKRTLASLPLGWRKGRDPPLEALRQPREESAPRTELRRKNPQPSAVADPVDLV